MLLNQNIHCVNANFDTVVALLDAFHNFPDIVLTETWLSEESDEFCNLDGYNVYHTVRAWWVCPYFVPKNLYLRNFYTYVYTMTQLRHEQSS